MSDFLTNLAARAVGKSQLVRPRVPSLFEPHPREGGLLPVAPAWRAREPEDNPAAALAPERRRAQRERPIVQTRVQPDDKAVYPAPASSTSAEQKTEAAEHSTTFQARPLVRPLRPEDHAIANPEESAGPNSMPLLSRMGAAPAVTGFAPPIPLRIPQPGPIREHTAVEAGTLQSAPVRRLDRAIPPSVRRFGQPSLKATVLDSTPEHPALPLPSSPAAAPPIRATTPPPAIQTPLPAIAPRKLSAPPIPRPTPINPQPRPEPSINVSIGRVEVRAIFPEAPAPRPPAPRARPTVSLDEYLKRTR